MILRSPLQKPPRYQVRGMQATHQATAPLFGQAQTQPVETFVTDVIDEIDAKDAHHKTSNFHPLICNLHEYQRPAVDGYQFCYRRHAYHGRSREVSQYPSRSQRVAVCVDSIRGMSIRMICKIIKRHFSSNSMLGRATDFPGNPKTFTETSSATQINAKCQEGPESKRSGGGPTRSQPHSSARQLKHISAAEATNERTES